MKQITASWVATKTTEYSAGKNTTYSTDNGTSSHYIEHQPSPQGTDTAASTSTTPIYIDLPSGSDYCSTY